MDTVIEVRKIDKQYREVKVGVGHTWIELGLLGKKECFELAGQLESIIDDLTENWD